LLRPGRTVGIAVVVEYMSVPFLVCRRTGRLVDDVDEDEDEEIAENLT